MFENGRARASTSGGCLEVMHASEARATAIPPQPIQRPKPVAVASSSRSYPPRTVAADPYQGGDHEAEDGATPLQAGAAGAPTSAAAPWSSASDALRSSVSVQGRGRCSPKETPLQAPRQAAPPARGYTTCAPASPHHCSARAPAWGTRGRGSHPPHSPPASRRGGTATCPAHIGCTG